MVVAVLTPNTIELRFAVPASAHAALAVELARGSRTVARRSLAAMYLDTPDRRLALAGITWCLRREGRRWIQTLKAGASSALVRYEHPVIRPHGSHDAAAHVGTPVGDRLIVTLRKARRDGVEPGVRCRSELRRTRRRIQSRRAVVDISYDEGRLLSAQRSQRIRELRFALVTGPSGSMLALAERWRKRFGLIYEPHSKAERGDRLAEGSGLPALRKSARPSYPPRARAAEAFSVVVDECLAHITRNAMGLCEGDPDLRVAHVHQLRVGIRRLRSALRIFQAWVPAPPAPLVDELRALFATLGQARDADVLGSGVAAALAQAGAPPLTFPAGTDAVDPVAAVRADAAQRLLLAWIAWRVGLTDVRPGSGEIEAVKSADDHGDGGETAATATPADALALPTDAGAGAGLAVSCRPPRIDEDAAAFRQDTARRLRRWHRRIVADWQPFDTLDDEAMHALRKRIKRQRYAVEFFAPVLRRRSVERYLESLSGLQDRMGELNDLFVARARYQTLVDSDPAAWFALGWLAARIAAVRASIKPALRQLSKARPPSS